MPTIVPLPFFCRDVSNYKKLRMAQKIMTFETKMTCLNRHATGFGKHVLPSVPVAEEHGLSNFIGQDSRYP